MKQQLLRLNLILFLLIVILSWVDAQIHKRLSFEAGVNRSMNINTKRIVSGWDHVYEGRWNSFKILNESPSFTTNYSFILGYRIIDKHQIKIRYSKNKLGSSIDAHVIHRNFSLIEQSYFLDNYINLLENTSWGILYEYQFTTDKGCFPIGLGLERLKNDIVKMRIVAPGILFTNYAIHATIGYMYPIFKYTYISAKAFATKSFTNNNMAIHFAENNGMYVPLQLGLELGLRFGLEE